MRHSQFAIVSFLLLTAVLRMACAQSAAELLRDGRVQARAYVEPAGDVYLAQQVRYFIEVRTDSWFTDAPRYPDLRIDDAIALLPERFGTNFSERERGQTIVGQRRGYLIYPQLAGVLEVPAQTVTLGVSVDGKPSELLTLRTNPVTVRVVVPDAARDVAQLVTTPSLTVRESYDRKLEDLAVGNAFVRTVTLSGEDTQGLVLPRITFTAPDGIAVYPAQPRIKDTASRGRYSGERTDSATFVLEQAGEYELPAIEISWWNPRTSSLQTETLSTVEFGVAAAPSAAGPVDEAAAEPWTNRLQAVGRQVVAWITGHIIELTAVGGLVYLFALLWQRFAARMVAAWRDYRVRRAHSERRYFAEFAKALRSGNADEAVASFWRWLDRVPAVSSPRDLIATSDRGAELSESLEQFEAGRYGSGEPTEKPGRDLYRLLSHARRRLLKRTASTTHDLHGLNPRTPGCDG